MGRTAGTWRGVIGLGLLAGLAWAPARAEPRSYVIEPGRSQIRFHAMSRLMNADGTFGRFSGEIELDDAHPETASGQLGVDVASLDTGIRMRDRHLRSEDFFHAERFPRATFVASTVRRQGDRWEVSGQLTIRGVTRSVTVPVTVTTAEGRLRIAGELTVNRQEFGVAYQSVLNPIHDEVRVRFDLVAVPR